MEARDHSRDRGVRQRALWDRPVIVVGDAFDRFVDDPRFVVGYEYFARKAWEIVWVASQPDAEEQQHHWQQHGESRKHDLSYAGAHTPTLYALLKAV